MPGQAFLLLHHSHVAYLFPASFPEAEQPHPLLHFITLQLHMLLLCRCTER